MKLLVAPLVLLDLDCDGTCIKYTLISKLSDGKVSIVLEEPPNKD